MAKQAPGVRLLRTLTRAAKTQQTTLRKLLVGYATPPKKRARKSPSAQTHVQSPSNSSRRAQRSIQPAPGLWLAGRSPLPISPGQALVEYMQYWLYLPKNVPDNAAQEGWPLIVMLHGCQQSASEFAEGTRMNQLAEENGYAVLYPQQLVKLQRQRCWRWYDRSVQQGAGETLALAALIRSVCEQHTIDRRRIYACGLSAGAGMAAMLALNHPELIAAVGMHSGPVFGAGHTPMGALHVMRHGAPAQADGAIPGVLQRRAANASPGAPEPMPVMPAVLIQGDDDQVVRPINQQHLTRQWLQLNGVPEGSTARVTVKPAGRGGKRNAHEIQDYLVRRKLLLRVVRIAGLGHAWSGGAPDLRFNAEAGPEASRMMLAFFGRHRR